ncbi:MAG: hypothetical protein V4665_00065 [Patescibacteria group bacterium]
MKTFLAAIIFFMGSMATVYAAPSEATGFLPDSVWYSQDSFVPGDTIKIYAGVWNAESKALSARIEFYDKKVVLGTRDISVPAQTLKEVSVSWKVTAGDHAISARVSSSNLVNGSKKEPIVLHSASTSEDRLSVSVTSGSTSAGSISSITEPVSERFDSVDDFRLRMKKNIAQGIENTKKDIDTYTKEEQNSAGGSGTKPLDQATEKPIAYIKLFFLSILGFMCGSQVVFYGILVFLIFLIGRFLYRKIRNR